MSKEVKRSFRHLHHEVKDRIRDFKASLFEFLFGSNSCFIQSISLDDPILILRLDDKIGDSIAATGFLRELKNTNPQSKVIVLAGPSSALIYKKLSFIDEVLIVKKGFFKSLGIFLRLRRFKFKYIINTSHILSPRVIFLCSQLMAYKKITFLNAKSKVFNEHAFYDAAVDHVTVRYISILKTLNSKVNNYNLEYEINLDSDQENRALRLIQDLKIRFKKVIILNSFAGARFRNFNRQTTLDIITKLIVDRDLVVVSIGNHNDLHLAEEWISELKNDQWVCFAGEYDLSFNFGLVKYADLVITPDTALVHVASAFKKDLVCVFREDRSDSAEKNCLIWAPHQTRSRILYALPKKENPEDINSIDGALIAEAAFALLK